MNVIPLHLQRRFEQRWAARFLSPATSGAPKGIAIKRAPSSVPVGAFRNDKGKRALPIQRIELS